MVFPYYVIITRLLQYLFYQILGKKTSSLKENSPQQQQNEVIILPQLSSSSTNPKNINLSKTLDSVDETREFKSMICDIDATILRTQSFFPYFMLVAFEGGSLIRALCLLLTYPILSFLEYEAQIRVMSFITFCGLKIKDMSCVERAVLPKYYLEEVNYNVYKVMCRAKYKAVFTSVPNVMVERFLKEYLRVDHVFGSELHTFGNYFSGFVLGSGDKHRAVIECFGEQRPDVGIGNSTFLDHPLFLSPCKEIYMVNLQEGAKRCGTSTSKMPREKYPKPLIFHDGRLAFLPTPSATLCMFMWFPLGLFLALYRLFVGIYLPYNIGRVLGQLSGIRIRIKGMNVTNPTQKTIHQGKGVLYVCTHRTLLDPIMLSFCLGKKLTAVTYSLSKVSELIAPLRTVRLTRDRVKDGQTMERLLSEGDLVVCPEGTTCREPYLLRFSPLFAELADEIVPVGLETKVSMFYGTTASGLKCLDPLFFLMNPSPIYYLHVLGKVPKEETCGGGGKTSFEVANHLQRELARAMGFECTTLTRKDKYLMLAGNDGRVGP